MSSSISHRALTPGSDRQVLTTRGGKVVWRAAASGSLTPEAGRSPRLLPFGVKLRGANVVPMGSAGNPWATLYANWGTQWGTIVKPQIDAAASVGANAIRLVGDVGGVHTGVLTIDAYTAAYEQFVDYCANLGLYAYACLGSSHTGGATVAQMADIMAPTAAMLETKSNVIGIDVVQEVGLGTGLSHSDVATLFAAIRAVCTLPLTCSVLGSDNSNAAQWSSATTAAYADLVDFYDFHPYYDGMVPADLAPFFAATDKPLILGEYGADVGKPARIAAAADVSALEQVVGSFYWSIVDNDPAYTVGGLFDGTFTERTNLTTLFRTVPDHVGALSGSGHTLEDEGVTLPARGRVNFVGNGVTAEDDPAGDATKVTIPGVSLTVQDENANVVTGVTVIDLQGAGVVATAGAAGEVIVTIGGAVASGGSGELLMQNGVTAPPVPVESEDRSDWLYQG